MNIRSITSIALILVGMVCFTSCSDKEEMGKVALSVSLTDSPGDYEEVNVEILGVQEFR
ncbi:hypothetical protein BH23BAC1_BH23BAC1_18130 [soil metagenome]